MNDFNVDLDRWYNHYHRLSYLDSPDVVSHLKEERYLKQVSYIRPLIESFIRNDVNGANAVKPFYDSTLSGTTDYERKKELRCVVENFVAEQSQPSQQHHVRTLAANFARFDDYILSLHRAHNYQLADDLAREVVREFCKLFLQCNPFYALQCVTNGITANINGITPIPSPTQMPTNHPIRQSVIIIFIILQLQQPIQPYLPQIIQVHLQQQIHHHPQQINLYKLQLHKYAI